MHCKNKVETQQQAVDAKKSESVGEARRLQTSKSKRKVSSVIRSFYCDIMSTMFCYCYVDMLKALVVIR